jgi:hypothetical protein
LRHNTPSGGLLEHGEHSPVDPRVLDSRCTEKPVDGGGFEQGPGNGLRRREPDEDTCKLDGLINVIAEGLRTPALQSELEELEQRKLVLEAELSAAPPPAPLLHPNLAEVYRQKVARLQEALEHLRGLIDGIVLHPTEKGVEIELIGVIAAMIDLGTHNKKPILRDRQFWGCIVVP